MWTGLGARLQRAATLDGTVFAEVAADPHATGPALAVVLASACAEGIGRLPAAGLDGLLVGTAQGCLAWMLWLLGIQVSARVTGLASHLAPMFRALGFAALPFALGALESLPVLGVLVSLAKWALGLAAAVTALIQLLEVELGRALLLCVGGLAVAVVLSYPVAWLLAL